MEEMEMNVKMNVIKRNGKEVPFDITKIVNAIGKANNEVDHVHQMNDYQIRAVADNIAHKIAGYSHSQCRRHSGYGRNGHHGNARL